MAPDELERVYVSARSPVTLSHWEKWVDRSRLFSPAGNAVLARRCDVLLLSVKPKDLPQLRAEMGEIVPPKLIVSLVAGRSLRFLEELFGCDVSLVRALPNVAVAVGKGLTACAAGPGVEPSSLEWVLGFFGRLGRAILLEERLLDPFTVLAGCGPAYGFLFLSLLTEAGMALGWDDSESRAFAVSLLDGVVGLSEAYPSLGWEEFVQWVRSPDGVTDTVCRQLERGRWRESFLEAIQKGVEKLVQMQKEAGDRRV